MRWAEVKRRPGIVEVRVNRDVETEREYVDFMVEAEQEYMKMDTEFVLVFNLNFSGVNIQQAAAWMELFERVRPVSASKLICTCVCSSSSVVLAGARLFTRLHSAVKPFHVYESEEECMSEAQRKFEHHVAPFAKVPTQWRELAFRDALPQRK